MSAKLLLLEDDPAIARTVAYALERDGLTVTHSLLVHDARQQLQRARFDLLVLDVGLPDGSGLDLLRDVRNAAPTAALPVLMLSAHGEEIDRVLGLELGADDYLTKPFSPRELAARVKALRRRASTACCPTCCEAQAAFIRATRCWPLPGATTARALTARWTPISRPCAPSCARWTRGASTSAHTGAWGIASIFKTPLAPVDGANDIARTHR